MAALIAALAACGRAPSTPETRGKAIFAGYNCKQCHRVGYEGGTLGADLTFLGFRKSAQFLDVWLHDPSGWKMDTVMPRFYFKDSVRKDLVAYLATLKGQHYKENPPWDAEEFRADPVKRGAELFTRLGCATCHGKGGVGGYPNNNVVGGEIPKLTTAADGYTKEELIAKIKEGVRHPVKADPAGPDPMLYMPAWGEVLKDDEIAALADYLISLKPKGAAGDEW